MQYRPANPHQYRQGFNECGRFSSKQAGDSLRQTDPAVDADVGPRRGTDLTGTYFLKTSSCDSAWIDTEHWLVANNKKGRKNTFFLGPSLLQAGTWTFGDTTVTALVNEPTFSH